MRAFIFSFQAPAPSNASNATLGKIPDATILSIIQFTTEICPTKQSVKVVVSKWCSSLEQVILRFCTLESPKGNICSVASLLLEKGPLFQAQICNFTICLHMSERPIVNSSLVLYCVSEHYQVKRTCTDEFDVNFFMVNHACMTEGHRHGHMCFCEEDECNAANPTKLKPISFFSAFSASLLLLLCVQS